MNKIYLPAANKIYLLTYTPTVQTITRWFCLIHKTLYKINSFEWHFKDIIHLFLLPICLEQKKEITMVFLKFFSLANFLQQALSPSILYIIHSDIYPSIYIFSSADSTQDAQCALLNIY